MAPSPRLQTGARCVRRRCGLVGEREGGREEVEDEFLFSGFGSSILDAVDLIAWRKDSKRPSFLNLKS